MSIFLDTETTGNGLADRLKNRFNPIFNEIQTNHMSDQITTALTALKKNQGSDPDSN
jgi:hypothetical protein